MESIEEPPEPAMEEWFEFEPAAAFESAALRGHQGGIIPRYMPLHTVTYRYIPLRGHQGGIIPARGAKLSWSISASVVAVSRPASSPRV